MDELARRIGGRLCLEFVNTVRGRVAGGGARRARDYADRIVGERLVSYEALVRWAVLAGVTSDREARALARQAGARPEEATAVLKRGLAVREALYRLFKAAVEGWTPQRADLLVFNRELQVARTREQLVAAPRFAWAWRASPGALDRVLWPIVRSAAELLTGPDVQRVGQCPGEECGWLFLDTSRSRRRQWCDMADCGNRAKVRRFRRRHRSRPRRQIEHRGDGADAASTVSRRKARLRRPV